MLYPPSLSKILLGDYGHPNTPAINWGTTHKEEALSECQGRVGFPLTIILMYYIHVLEQTESCFAVNPYFRFLLSFSLHNIASIYLIKFHL